MIIERCHFLSDISGLLFLENSLALALKQNLQKRAPVTQFLIQLLVLHTSFAF
jgi:hypothetical protein